MTNKTLGQKNRNPLNIRFSPRNKWTGSVGQNKGFVVFRSMDYGYRAALKLLSNYVKNGYNTISSVISRWAPESENDTDAYIKTVCSKLDFYNLPNRYDGGSRFIAWTGADVVDQALLPYLCAAMAYVESREIVDPVALADLIVKHKIYV